VQQLGVHITVNDRPERSEGTPMDSEQDTPITETATLVQEQATMCAEGVSTLVAAGQALIGGCQAMSAEMLAFWQSRLKEGLNTGQRLIECDSPEVALEIQMDYAKTALQAYLDQSAKIGDLVSRSFTQGLLPEKPSAPQAPAVAA
jgi:hypothetical protein